MTISFIWSNWDLMERMGPTSIWLILPRRGRKDTDRRPCKKSDQMTIYKTQRVFRGDLLCWHLDLRLLVSRTMKKYFPVVINYQSTVLCCGNPCITMQDPQNNTVGSLDVYFSWEAFVHLYFIDRVSLTKHPLWWPLLFHVLEACISPSSHCWN